MLLLADEQENMIDKYLERGEMFILDDNGVKAECVVTNEAGDVPSALSFYTNCGFIESHRIKNFFIDNYDHPMFEDDIQLVDMVYLKKTINSRL